MTASIEGEDEAVVEAEDRETISKSAAILLFGASRILQAVLNELGPKPNEQLNLEMGGVQMGGRFLDPGFYPQINNKIAPSIKSPQGKTREGWFEFKFPYPFSVAVRLIVEERGSGWIPERGRCVVTNRGLETHGFEARFRQSKGAPRDRVAELQLRPVSPPSLDWTQSLVPIQTAEARVPLG